MEKIKVSVLMSIYFKEKPEYFRESLESILNQTYFPDEIVLVKDGPLTNELEEVIKEYKEKLNIKTVPLEKNLGLGLALKEGVLHCSNEIIIRMDTDDIAIKNRIEEQVKIFNKDKEIGIVGSNAYNFENIVEDLETKSIFPKEDLEIQKFAKRRCPFLHPTVAFKKSIVLKVGNYNNLLWFEDYDIFLRILKISKGYNIQIPLLYFRSNSDLYKRRGGIGYIKREIKALTKFYKDGNMNLYYYLTNIFIRFGVRICGNNLRMKIYKKFLRGKNNE